MSGHVAVRLPSWLGDAVMAEPVLRAVHARAARTTLVGATHVLELFEERFDGAHRIAVARGERENPACYSGATHALLLNGSWSSAFAAARARVPARTGFATRGRRMLLTHPVTPALERGGLPLGIGVRGRRPRLLPRPFASACRELAAQLGVFVDDVAPRLAPSARGVELVRARRIVDSEREPFILVHAGSREASAKGVPPSKWGELVDALARAGLPRCVLLCAPEEEGAARAAFAAQHDPRTLLVDAPAAGMAELVAWSARAALVITADNGARHVAQALGKPTLVLFGPTDPRHTAEHGANVRGVRVDVPCGPCHAERCPLSGPDEHACMRRIDVAALVARARQLVFALAR